MVDLSVIIPAYNEQDSVIELHARLSNVLQSLGWSYEIVFVDDHSTDATFERLSVLYLKDKHVRVVRFRRNFGQTAALDAGFKLAQGRVFVALDADLQNAPEDIPLLLEKLLQGYDVVSGWRWQRRDSVSKKLFSWLANSFRKWLTGERIHDSGCTLKAYKRECFENLTLFGEMHRYIPAILAWQGFRIGEVKVRHDKRKYGMTKYSMTRVMKGFLDLLFIKFWNDYSARPLHFFGLLSFIQLVFAGLIFVEQLVKAFLIGELALGPLFLVGVLFVMTGSLTVVLGFLAEILIRTYYKDSKNYVIEKVLMADNNNYK